MNLETHEEFLNVLQNTRLGPRILGFEYLLGLSATDDGILEILSFKKYVPFLVKYIGETNCNKETLSLAYKCVINISTVQEGVMALLNSKDLVISLLNRICDINYKFIKEICYILSNMSRYKEILQQNDCFLDAELLDKILKVFMSNHSEVKEKFQFLALYFANMSGYPSRRKLMLENEKFIDFLFSSYIFSSETNVRRIGIALTLRNLCSEQSSHAMLLEKGILPVLLLPLMGSEEYEEEEMEKLPLECQYLEDAKERERLPVIRRALVQALSLLCYTKRGWEYLKEHSVYYVTRELHKWEADFDTKEAIETLVGFLLVIDYSKMSHEADELVTPSVTEILKDIPDFVVS
ncbi:protein HGH1 homolog [Trichonephila inaurata madagascariensis]|uniref:Protein HGH1 homolog n=1 Tax=Trichonephila inaurata madagascariensis TaxID=2747483 RepID=A0A8X7C7F1_9ARAC|nr:protein HGH1 homolog [Trichonephila inaurata madagascariensis]